MSTFFGLPAKPRTLVEVSLEGAQKYPDRIAQFFLPDGETIGEKVTFGELDLKVKSIAAELQFGYSKGERAILIFEPGLEFIAGYLGCLYSGIIPIPVYPIHPKKIKQNLPGLLNIVKDSCPTLILTQSSYRLATAKVFDELPELKGINWECTDLFSLHSADSWTFPEINDESIAFIQYTSGSTRNPRGVVITHGNLFNNLSCIGDRFQHTPESLVVSWLPPYHDMGLIGSMLQPIFAGVPIALMPPLMFIQRPIRWLKAISDFKATSSGGPNFGYEHCVNKIRPEERAEFDLSSWEIAWNGAEPINAGTIQNFTSYFATSGFRPQSFFPCYGLAEGTLMATSVEKQKSPIYLSILEQHQTSRIIVENNNGNGSIKRQKVSCGTPVAGMDLRIVDPNLHHELPEETIGEIWLKGPSVAKMYFNRAPEDQSAFKAIIIPSGEGPFLRTGDMGFKHNGELFITGRIKDVIVLNGYNHFASDIEWTVQQSHSAIRDHASAAFYIEVDGTEQLVVMSELDTNYLRKHPEVSIPDVKNTIIHAISLQHQIKAFDIVLLENQRIQKTSSGKIKRQSAKADYINMHAKVVLH